MAAHFFYSRITLVRISKSKLQISITTKSHLSEITSFCSNLPNIVNIVQHSHSYNSFLLISVACIVILLVAILYRDHVGFCVIVTFVICLKNLDNFTKTCMILTQTWAIGLLLNSHTVKHANCYGSSHYFLKITESKCYRVTSL
jgi:hypothetical protein